MNNKKTGNATEEEVAKIFREKGYWCHIFAYNQNGQPCDIIACKNDTLFLIDVKHCKDGRFDFNRIEPNQQTCFKYAHDYCGIKRVGFIIKFYDQVYKWLPYTRISNLNEKSVRAEDLMDLKEIL